MHAIHRALRARGADVRIATHGGTYEWVLRRAGVEYDVIGPGLTPQRCAEFVRSVPGAGPPDRSQWSDEELRRYAVAEAAYLESHCARVAVTGWTLTALLSTRLARIPLVTEHAGSWVPPMYERGLLPAPLGRVGMPLERWLPATVRRRMFNARMHEFSGYTSGFNRVAAELGVDGVPSFPALLLGDLTLVTDVPELLGVPAEAIDRWVPRHPGAYRAGTRLRMTGPIFARLDIPLPARVEELLDGPAPKIYVAITSSRPELVRTAVGALRPLGARILVAGTVHDLGDLEDDLVMVEGVLPSHRVMPRVDLAVMAGGRAASRPRSQAGCRCLGCRCTPSSTGRARACGRGDHGGRRDGSAGRDPGGMSVDDGSRRAARLRVAVHPALGVDQVIRRPVGLDPGQPPDLVGAVEPRTARAAPVGAQAPA